MVVGALRTGVRVANPIYHPEERAKNKVILRLTLYKHLSVLYTLTGHFVWILVFSCKRFSK